jgi:hypothetical protein
MADVKAGCDEDGEWHAYNAELAVQLEQYDGHDWSSTSVNDD